MEKYLKKIKIILLTIVFFISLFSNSVIGFNQNSYSTYDINIIQNSKNGETEYWALLVAVGEYADDPEQNRPLMLEEVDDLYDVLLESETWSADHIKVIKADDATASNIISGLKWLDKMEDENDFSLVFISTHGSYLPFDIPPFDEEDNTDEFLVSYWGFAYDTSFIYDDQLNIMLNRLESKGVCLIVDSCYAGGFNDPSNLIKKNIYNYESSQNKISSQEWIQGFGAEVRGQKRVVLMASCEDELSYSGGFAPYVIDGLRGFADNNNDGIVSAEETFYYTLPRAYRQTPTIYDGYDGDLPLIYLNDQPRNNQRINKDSSYNINNQNVSISSIVFSLEDSIINGFIIDSNTNDPIENAQVHIEGRTDNWEFFENETTSNIDGYYSINVPPSRSQITINVDGYCSEESHNLNIDENQLLWVNFTLFPRPQENSIVCGYVFNNNNDKPIVEANITLFWIGEQNQFYINDTSTDQSGFYTLNVASGVINLEIEADGYFREFSYDNLISDYETLILNISLRPYPIENSFIYGYIIDKETGFPINNARITFQWINITSGDSYQKVVYTDLSGFFSLIIAPGEVYNDVRESEYIYYYPYRLDVKKYKTLWLNITLERQKTKIGILKPLRAFYINNNRITPFKNAIIIGKIDVEAYVYEDFYGPGHENEVEKVEFFIDNNLRETLTSEPYILVWEDKTIGKHIIKVIVYEDNGNTNSKEIEVYKLL